MTRKAAIPNANDNFPFSASPRTPTKPTRPGWNWRRLTDVARLATGHTPSRRHPEYWQGEIPWIQLADIRALDGHEAFNTSEHTNELGIENSAAVLLPRATVCMSRTASVGFFTILGRPMATSQDFVNWICGSELDPWFLMYLLSACRKPIKDLGSGAVHHTIYFPTVQDFSVCLPSLSEQQRIIRLLREQLAAAEKARAAAQARLKAISALPAAFVRQVFPQPGQALPAGWCSSTLGDLCEGPGQYGTSKKSNNDRKGVPVLGMYHIHEGRIRWENMSHVELPSGELTKYLLRWGDLLFNRTNSAELVGKSAVYYEDAEAVFASYLIRFRFAKDAAEPDFVCAYINSRNGRAFIERNMGRAIGQVNVSASTMHKMPIPVPEIAEQRRIAGILRDQMAVVERARAAAEEEMKSINALPAALLRQAIDGEL